MEVALDTLTLAALAVLAVHFGVPLAYFAYLRYRWLPRPLGVKRVPGYTPTVTVIVPTYNEAGVIAAKLDNLASQDYPRDKLEVIVVDSASTDGTPGIVLEWAKRNPGFNIRLVAEKERRGKIHALNKALGHAKGEIVVITDADALWMDKDTLRRAVEYLGDERVGAVSCIKIPAEAGRAGFEKGYRSLYNLLRVAESKIHSTPIFHGELAAFRRSLLERIGGFDPRVGADDSHTATRIALMGYRSIVPEDVVVKELVPREKWFKWRVRRAQHLIQHFARSLLLLKKHKPPRGFLKVLLVEAYLHLVNPWLLVIGAGLLAASLATRHSILSAALLATGLAALPFVSVYRVWLIAQLALVVASLRNLVSREIVWEKQSKSIG